MERVRVGDLHDSPYGGARFLYNDCSQQKAETVDLLRMVPTMSRPGILKNSDSGIKNEEAEHRDTMSEGDTLDSHKANNLRRGSRKSLGDIGTHRCGKNNTDEAGIEMINTGSRPCHVDLPEGPSCAPHRNMMVYCSREAVEEEHSPHLCQKHARELLDNQTNNLYDHHQRVTGHCVRENSDEDPYYTKVPPHLYNNHEKAGFASEGSGGANNVHFNYLKQMKQPPKDGHQSRSTLSLPAVTYTFGKKVHGNKNIFKKPSSFLKPSCGNASKAYTPTEDFLDSKCTMKSSSKSFSRFKRLVLVACILMGVVLAIGGIIIGFVILQSQTQTPQDCGPDYIDCGDQGCIHLDDVCSDVITQCPGYTLGALCQHNTQENTSSAEVPVSDIQQNKSVSVISKFVFDDSNWVHFTNFSGAESMYQVIDKYLTFTSAQEECYQYGGHLAHVTSIREQVFLEDYIRSLYPTPKSLSGVRGFWIGARRRRGSNTKHCLQYKQWQWLDNIGRVHGVVEGFSAFKDGKPDNFYNPEECLIMNTETVEPDVFDESFLKWDDLPCDFQGHTLIKPLCEVDLKRFTYPS